jgi:hypothetical protein
MLHHLEYIVDRFKALPSRSSRPAGEHLAVAIRRAHDADLPLLHDLAELDGARPLAGPVLVAVVEGALWAAIGLDDGRVIADPFLPTSAAVELLALRARQLRGAPGRPSGGILPRRIARRARA